MKLSIWAKSQGISYRTAHRLFQSGDLPCRSEQLSTGTILVFPEEIKDESVAIYARVASHDQKEDLQRQIQRLRDFAASKGMKVTLEKSEIGSGLNGRRKELLKLLEDKSVTIIIVEHRDRLARFGVEYIEAAMKSANKKLIVLNETEQKDDLTQDFVDVVTSLCAKIYGKRSAKNKAQKALKAINED